MARVLFGSILVPDNADREYLAGLGLSDKDIEDALASSTVCGLNYKINDPLSKEAMPQKKAESPENSTNVLVPSASDTSSDMADETCKKQDQKVSVSRHATARKEPSIFKKKKKEEAKGPDIPLKQEADISEWIKFSLTPHTEDEIREKILTDFDNVCFTYICGEQVLSEDFILELAALSTGLLDKENYVKYIDYMKKAVMITNGMEKGTYNLRKLPKNKNITAKNVGYLTADRLDWKAIAARQNLSPEFRKKYHKLMYPGPLSYASAMRNAL